eukprot:gene23842-biopygen13400
MIPATYSPATNRRAGQSLCTAGWSVAVHGGLVSRCARRAGHSLCTAG